MSDRFILFSLGRCGSTTLEHLLNCHPDIRCIHEPFNKDSPDARPVEDAETLDSILEVVWANYNGIKHVYSPMGWPFPPRSTLNRYLVLRPGQRVVLLHRRNLLQQVVSTEIAKQSRIFEADRAEYRRTIEDFRFEPITDRRIEYMLMIWRRDLKYYRREFARKEIPFMNLTYEELFGVDRKIEKRRETLRRVFQFLGRDPAAEGIDQGRIDSLLDPSRLKVNSAETYRLVPGIERIERRFGSRRNGWLFKRGNRWSRIFRRS